MATSFPVQRDMTRVAELVNILRVQRIEVGQATSRDQNQRRHVPRRLLRDQARSALRPPRQEPAREAELSRIPNLRTYDDSGWTMGLAMLVEVKEIKDKAILERRRRRRLRRRRQRARSPATGTAGLAVAHFGSNNMIALPLQARRTCR